MSKRADDVVAELRRIERARRVSTALAIVVAFGIACTIVIHSWVVRIAITGVAAVVVWLLARLASRALDPFMMDDATRARRTGAASAKAEAEELKMEDKRDEA